MSSDGIAKFVQEKYMLEESVSEIIQIWNMMARDYYENAIQLKAGLDKYLSFLKSQKIRIGIATGGAKVLVELFLNSHNYSQYIDLVVDTSVVKRGKPSSDIYQYVADFFNVPYEKCLVYEDIIECALSVRKIGMKTCIVQDEKEFDEIKEEFRVIGSFDDEISLLWRANEC